MEYNHNYTIPGYDRWKLASPPEWDEEEENDDPLDDGDEAYDRQQDDKLCDERD